MGIFRISPGLEPLICQSCQPLEEPPIAALAEMCEVVWQVSEYSIPAFQLPG